MGDGEKMSSRDFDEAMYQQHKDWEAEQEYYASESAKAQADIENEGETISESLLLTDEEICQTTACAIAHNATTEPCKFSDKRACVLFNTVKLAEPLIRADERAKVLKEVGEWLEKQLQLSAKFGGDIVTQEEIDNLKQGKLES